MSANRVKTHTKAVRKQTLGLLAELYLYPQSATAVARALRSRFHGIDTRKARDCFSYLEKKGYIKRKRSKDGRMKAGITSSGIDLVEGATHDNGVLPVMPDFTGLMARRSVRYGILSITRQFPDSYNGDDEIMAELKELGMTHLMMEQIRFHIWYLNGKNLLEMKTSPLHGDVVFYARITAKGMDLLDANLSDPGVTQDE